MAAERVEASLGEVLRDYPVTSFNFFLKCANLSLRLRVVLKAPPKQDLEMKDKETKRDFTPFSFIQTTKVL